MVFSWIKTPHLGVTHHLEIIQAQYLIILTKTNSTAVGMLYFLCRFIDSKIHQNQNKHYTFTNYFNVQSDFEIRGREKELIMMMMMMMTTKMVMTVMFELESITIMRKHKTNCNKNC